MLEKLEASLELLRQEKPFYSLLMSSLKVIESDSITAPAAIGYDEKIKKFTLVLNSEYINSFSVRHVTGIIIHELLHILHSHHFRITKEMNKGLANISMDLAVNQYLEGNFLPPGVITLANAKKATGIDLKPLQTWEYYYNQLLNCKVPSSGSKSIDEHNELDVSSEDYAEERKNIVRRSLNEEKHFSTCPDFVKEEFDNFKAELTKLNYQAILKRIVRKSIIKGQKRTYSRLNKRYGQQVKGYQDNKEAKIAIYIDTSGSMSATEIGQEIEIIQNLCKITKTDIVVKFFHTAIYQTKKFMSKETVQFKKTEAGGTELTCVINDIEKTHSDLNIIITDGYYDTKRTNISKPVLFLITKEGTEKHSLSNLGYTLVIQN
jgi:predicted metal-dependent peptidase